MKPLLLVFTLAGLAGCTSSMQRAEQTVTAALPAVETIEFRELAAYPGNVVCGDYRSIQRYGDSPGFKPFIVRAEQADVLPSAEDRRVFCDADPIARLYELTGIQASPAPTAQLRKIADDLTRLQTALLDYYRDVATYPQTDPGLESLIRPVGSMRRAGRFREGGYLQSLPQDPWQRAYQYAAPEFAGSHQPPSLLTLGADATPGGTDENADISLNELHYLQHVLSLSTR
ncbi:MAG: type II secretion system protein GspG [Haliea sp.]|jgi:general secretion pathway protein G|nr:type II secretion system protein GspG [Haliea sp.]MDP5064863.1 type II secretion system protein GspG [Haliea sp.]